MTPIERALASPPLAVGAALLGLALALRVCVMLGSGTGLHVDEAQYWWWSQSLQAGYFSKPPLIAVLIAASTGLAGDGVLGVRLLAMACWPAAGAVLWALGRDMAGERAGRWAALVWLATPLAGLLGLVATTDAPLVLAWALGLWALWRGVVRGSRWAWLGLGTAVGCGLLAKYTMAAFLPGAAAWALRHGGRPAWRGLAIALAVALLWLAPHLLWNMQLGWPTVEHVVQSSDSRTGGELPGLARAGLLLLGQAVVFGPVALVLALLLMADTCRQGRPPAPARRSRELVLLAVVPLMVLGLAQALRGRVEQNWLAPMHLGLALGLGQAIAARLPDERGRRHRHYLAALLAQALAVVLLALAPAAVAAWRPGSFMPPMLDPWARLRGWAPAFAQLAQDRDPTTPIAPGSTGQVPASRPSLRLVGTSRSALAHALYEWRGAWQGHLLRPVGWLAPDQPMNHFAMACDWARARQDAAPVLVISETALPAALAADLDDVVLLGEARVPRSHERFIHLRLYRAVPRLVDSPGPPTPPSPGACP